MHQSDDVQNATGRELTDAERACLEEIGRMKEQVAEFIQLMQASDVDKRWLNIAKTDLQKGFMSLRRSITKPDTF